MDLLFIIGNGFDLSCGAKTSYLDVYKEYVKEPSNSEVVSQFKKAIKGDINKWSDFEITMGQYACNLNNESEFIECVRDFSVFLNRYLKKINDSYIEEFKMPGMLADLDEEIWKLFNDFYIGITNDTKHEMNARGANKPETISVISFNYTTIFDNIIGDSLFSVGNPEPIIHVHGTLEEGIVMGVDSIDYIDSEYTLSGVGERCFIKPKLNEAFDKRRVERAYFKIDKANVICVFGAELGESDLNWRNKIISWLGERKDNILFVFLHESNSPDGMTLDQKIENEQKERRDLMEKWQIDDEYFNQIRIQCRKDVINPRSVIEVREGIMRKDTQDKIKKGKEIVEKQISKNGKRPLENGVE